MAKMYNFRALVIAITLFGSAYSQLTAQSSIAPELRECYTNGILLNRNNLPPTTIQVLIDIIQKIEDLYTNIDLRQLSSLLLHSYRQDGIEFHQPDINLVGPNVLPYAPTFHSFHRHRLLLTRLIPNSLTIFQNETLASPLKCAIHHMLSTTVDTRLRGDESVCNQLSQYRALRVPRDANSDNIREDVEILSPDLLKSANKNGQLQMYNPNDDVESAVVGGLMSERQISQSQCPLATGVVYTSWGVVSAGNLIAGIAAGVEPQNVPLFELTKVFIDPSTYQDVQTTVSSIYPATLSGDLAEAILIQGTERGSSSISIGTPGGWNSTQARKYHMLQGITNFEMTDAELRGGIDGFLLGTNLRTFQSQFGSLKLSQLLDMYYSAKNGVFNPSMRACNRRENQATIESDPLIAQTYAFAVALDTILPLRGTFTGRLLDLVQNSVTNMQNYANNNLNNVDCVNTESSSSDFRQRTNLYIALDSTWQYETVYPAISYLLDSIEVGKFGSSVTLLNAFDGSVVVDKTFSLADFHSAYTLVRHQSLLGGVNLLNALTNIHSLMLTELDNEMARNYVGGNSTVLLFLLNSGNLQNNNDVWERARMINDTVPDLRVLYATSTNHFDDLWNLVRDMHNDIKTVSLTSNGVNIDTAMNPVLDRIRSVNRRIINPLCGSQWQGAVSDVRQFDDLLEPGYTNFYTVSPNYFFDSNDERRVRISRMGVGVGTLVVCQSRRNPQPRENGNVNVGDGDDSLQCETITGGGNVEFRIVNPCDGFWTINTCPPLYISVQSVIGNTVAASASCPGNDCRFPYNVRYQVQINRFNCRSAAFSVVASISVLVVGLLVAISNAMQ